MEYDKELSVSRGNNSGELYIVEDDSWCIPVLGVFEQERFQHLAHLARLGSFAHLLGVDIVYVDTMGIWCSITASCTQTYILSAVGITNVSSGTAEAYKHLKPTIYRYCVNRPVIVPPISVNISTFRLEVSLTADKRGLEFYPCKPLLLDNRYAGDGSDKINGVCYNPVLINSYPQRFRYPGTSAYINFISPLFPQLDDLISVMWMVGNALLDPVQCHRVLLLSGPGGSGKSNVIRAITNALPGCANALPDNVLTNSSQVITDDLVALLLESRIATNGEVDLERGDLNPHIVKAITGEDVMRLGTSNVVISTSVMLATNGVPDIEDDIYTSDAITRRLLVIPMTVRAKELKKNRLDDNLVSKMDFLCACVYVRMRSDYVMPSARSMLATILLSKFDETCERLRFTSGGVTEAEYIEVLGHVAGALHVAPSVVVYRCRLISPHSLVVVNGNSYIKGVGLAR